jgi:N-acetylmuramoyl-L-alanine amidase
MRIQRRHLATIIAGLTLTGLAAFALPALAITHHPKTLATLKANAALATTIPPQRKIRVLIVPGHEPDAGGTNYGTIKERDLNVQLGQDLQKYLDADGHYQTFITRDAQNWNPTFSDYFTAHWYDIDAWRLQASAEMQAAINAGTMTPPVVYVGHNAADEATTVRLFGIMKWANKNDIDLVIHVHLDDDRDPIWSVGTHNGFAIFVPTPQYFNAQPTRAIADQVLARLAKFDPTSDFPNESSGIVEDPQLIAIGQDNTADVPSLLIEYAYIYEKQLRLPAVRALALNDQAYQTFLGVDDFFFGASASAQPTSVLPYAWNKTISFGTNSADVYALQTALILDGDSPPPGVTKNDCPRSGYFASCTRTALKLFQKKYGITGETGYAGKKTLAKLKKL